MGSSFRFVVYEEDTSKAKKAIAKGVEEITRIENMISEWKPHTPVSIINQSAGIKAVEVTEELFQLFKKAKQYSQQSDGLFDITYAGMEKIWKYDGTMDKLPSQDKIQKALEGVGNKYLILDENTRKVYLSHSKTRISFGSIGKAYAAQQAAKIMKQNTNVHNLMVDASGDIFVYGTPEHKKCWEIGIYQPYKKNNYRKICLKNEAIVTSGNYEKFALIHGKKYGHIINPKTGYPSSQIQSVSVKGKNAVDANFLSTTLMIANKTERKTLLHQYPFYRIWIQKNRE